MLVLVLVLASNARNVNKDLSLLTFLAITLWLKIFIYAVYLPPQT